MKFLVIDAGVIEYKAFGWGISGFRGGIGFGHRSKNILSSKKVFTARYTPRVRASETASDLVYFAHSYLTSLSVSRISAAVPSAIARNLYSACFPQLLLGQQLPILYPIADITLKKESKCSPVRFKPRYSSVIPHSKISNLKGYDS